MSTYFEAKTPNGLLQISDQFPALFLKKVSKLSDYYRTTWYGSYQPNGESNQRHELYYYDITPEVGTLLFIGNPTDIKVDLFTTTNELLEGIGYSNTHAQYRSHGSKHIIVVSNCTKNQADNLNVYEFTDSMNFVGNVGLECFDENGVKVFSSNAYPLKILAVHYEQHCPNTSLHDIWWAGSNFKITPKTYSYPNKELAFFCPYHGHGGAHDSNYRKSILTRLSKSLIEVKQLDVENIDFNLYKWYHDVSITFPISAQTSYTVIDVSNIPTN